MRRLPSLSVEGYVGGRLVCGRSYPPAPHCVDLGNGIVIALRLLRDEFCDPQVQGSVNVSLAFSHRWGSDPLTSRCTDQAPDPSLVKNIMARLAAHSSKRIDRTVASDPRFDSPIECSAAMSVWSMLHVMAPHLTCSAEMGATDREFIRAGFVSFVA